MFLSFLALYIFTFASDQNQHNYHKMTSTTSTTTQKIMGQTEQTLPPKKKRCTKSDSPFYDKYPGEPFATATQYVIITKDNIRENVQPGDHLSYTMSLCGKLQEKASNSGIILILWSRRFTSDFSQMLIT